MGLFYKFKKNEMKGCWEDGGTLIIAFDDLNRIASMNAGN